MGTQSGGSAPTRSDPENQQRLLADLRTKDCRTPRLSSERAHTQGHSFLVQRRGTVWDAPGPEVKVVHGIISGECQGGRSLWEPSLGMKVLVDTISPLFYLISMVLGEYCLGYSPPTLQTQLIQPQCSPKAQKPSPQPPPTRPSLPPP